MRVCGMPGKALATQGVALRAVRLVPPLDRELLKWQFNGRENERNTVILLLDVPNNHASGVDALITSEHEWRKPKELDVAVALPTHLPELRLGYGYIPRGITIDEPGWILQEMQVVDPLKPVAVEGLQSLWRVLNDFAFGD